MNTKKLFFKELSFLAKDYNFEFLEQQRGIDRKVAFYRDNFEIGFSSRNSQFDYSCCFYYSINGWRRTLDIEEEFNKIFHKKSNKNYFWQLGKVIEEQLKDNNIFNYCLYP